MHADRTNRTLLALFALIVFLIGAAGLAMSVGLFGTARSHRTLFDNTFSHFIGRNGQWLWPTAAIACVIVAALALRWILVLLVSTDRAGDLVMPGEEKSDGLTVLAPGALSTAVAAEISTYRGVASAKARMLGTPQDPELVVTVAALRAVDVADLRRRIESEALANVRHATDRPDLSIHLELSVGSRAGTRV